MSVAQQAVSMPGSLFIVAAPSGAGKTSLVRALLAREPGLSLSVSFTSRAPRPGEIDGVHYHFVSKPEFEAMAARGDFFEYFVVHGDLKGTARTAVEPVLAAGRDVLLEIDWQGARRVREQLPSAVGIFILPPSRAELERRLRARAQDSEATIQRRLANSRQEIAHALEFDYLIVNDEFERALEDMLAIVRSQRLQRQVQSHRLGALLAQLRA
jgi:guanylate kinase